MEISFIDKLGLTNSEYMIFIENKSKEVIEYSEFDDLPQFYNKISILLIDEETPHHEVIEIWGKAVNLSLNPNTRSKRKASSISNNKKGSIYISTPFIQREVPPDTEIKEYLEFILYHELCHLKLHQGKIITCSKSLMSLLELYEKIPQRKDFGKNIVNNLRQNNEHYFVNQFVVNRYPELFLKQRIAERDRMDWKMDNYPRMTHREGLDVTISEALNETISLTRKKIELNTIDKKISQKFNTAIDDLMRSYNELYDMFTALISKSVSPPNIAKIFSRDVFSDREIFGKNISDIWVSLRLIDPINVPIRVSLSNCGICRKPTKSHILDYGGYVCHSCWTSFFNRK